MQDYYNLEDIKNLLRYYDLIIESRRMINIIDLKIEQSKSAKNIFNNKDIINNYPWKGFKEKYIALELIINEFEHHQNDLSDTESKFSKKVMQTLVTSIRNIGYLSQEIHKAHIEKLLIREVGIIKETLLNPNYRRFSEAWLLLNTTPSKTYKREEVVSLIEGLIAKTEKRHSIKVNLITSKITESFFNLAQELDEAHIEILQKASNVILKFLIVAKANPEIFCFFIYSKVFLKSKINNDIVLRVETLDNLQNHYSGFFNEYGSESAIVISLSMRWKILLNQASAISSTS